MILPTHLLMHLTVTLERRVPSDEAFSHTQLFSEEKN
jgi:hypothetical protein